MLLHRRLLLLPHLGRGLWGVSISCLVLSFFLLYLDLIVRSLIQLFIYGHALE